MTATLADVRTSTLTYAAGDVVGYVSPLGVTPPANVVDPIMNPPWYCLGWLETGGVIFKLTETLKEIMAAGTLSAIRTIISGEAKTFDATFLEPLNPWVRALYDDVPIASLVPLVPRVDSSGTTTTSGSPTVGDTHAVAGDIGQNISGTGVPSGATITAVTPGTGYTISANATATGTPTLTVGTSSQTAYLLPEVRAANEYAFCFDSVDGDRRQRLFAVRGMITARGNDQVQQADNENIQMTISLYVDSITFGGVTKRGTCIRYLDYGSENSDLSGYFPA